MVIKDSSTVMKILEKSRLLQLKDLEEARTLSEQHPDSQDFLKILFRKKMVTRWQAGQLLAGNASFFLGKYKLIELLGAGGMGRVFRAEHITMNRSVALKIIAKDLVTDPEAQTRFLNEARAIAALNHPNIVHAYSVDKEGDRYYIVMEFVEGQDLDKFIEKNGTMSQDRVARYMHQAASALQHAHERNMIHCDIKPANLLLNEEADQVKILDMGLARFNTHKDSKTNTNTDANANVIGTVDYMAPEVADDSANASPQSDIYSLGCVMYFLLTGKIPFPGDTMPERILKHQNEDPVHPHEVNAELSQSLGDICMKMMARPLDERYATAGDVVEALTEWLSTSSHNEQGGESSISLDFSQFISSGSSASSFSSGSGAGSSAGKSGQVRKSGLFGKFSKSGTKKSSETSGILSKAGKSGVNIDFSSLSGTSNDLHDSALRVENSVDSADDTVVASVEDLTEATTTSNAEMEAKTGVDTNRPKMVQAVLLDDDEDDEEEVFTLNVATPKPAESAPALSLNAEKSGKSRIGKNVSTKSKKNVTNTTAGEKTSGKLQSTFKTVSSGVGNCVSKATGFWSNASGKQKIICASVAGGGLLLILVLVLVFALTGGEDKKVVQNSAENASAETIVEDVVEEVAEEVTEDETTETAETSKESETAEKEASPEEAGEAKNEDADTETDAENIESAENAENAENTDTENSTQPAENADATADDSVKETEGAEGAENATPAENAEGAESVESTENAENANGEATPTEEAQKAEAEAKAKAEEEAKKKAEEEVVAKAKAEEEAKKKAEAAAKAKAEAEAKAKLEPFQDSALSVDLPKPGTEGVALTDINHMDMDVQISLLGGDAAFQVRGTPKKPGVQTKFFSLTEGDGDTPTWEISYKAKDTETPVAKVTLDENTLNFKWIKSSVPPKDLPFLGNCALLLECNEKTHVLGLRTPIELETVTLNPKNGEGKLQGKLELPLPSLDHVYVEIVRIGDFPEEYKDLQLPSATKASEITNNTPMEIKFNFADANGNALTPVQFNLVSMLNNGVGGSIKTVMNGMPNGKALMGMINMARNPQIDIEIDKMEKEIAAIDKKNEDKAAHEKTAADSTKQSQLQLQVWMLNLAKQLVDVDFEYVIYADYDGNTIDLVTSRKMTEEERKAKKGGKSSRKKATEEAEEDGGFGGMKF